MLFRFGDPGKVVLMAGVLFKIKIMPTISINDYESTIIQVSRNHKPYYVRLTNWNFVSIGQSYPHGFSLKAIKKFDHKPTVSWKN